MLPTSAYVPPFTLSNAQDQGDTLIEGTAGTVTLAQLGDGSEKQLEFIVETKAAINRLHVNSWKHGVQVYQCGKHAAGVPGQAGTSGSNKRRRTTSGPAASVGPESVAAEQAGVGTQSLSERTAISGSRLWVLSSHMPLQPGKMCVIHTPGVLKVTVPVAEVDHDEGARGDD